jgi:hypothetical protein
MNLQEKLEYNKKSSQKFGWTPEWFGCKDFDQNLIIKIEEFQKELGVDSDGLVGPTTHRLISTKLQSESGEYIICGGKKVAINWPKVITMNEPGALSVGSKCYRKSPGRKPKSFIVHWDACLSSASCAKVLNERGLSVHFCIDNDGTIYQLIDTDDIGYHASNLNSSSVGVEVSNAFYPKYQDYYVKKGFGPRPVLKNTKVGGGTIPEHLMFYDVQERALSALMKAVCGHYGIPLEVPKTSGVYATGEHPEVASGKFNGVACHFHVTSQKIDCAGLDLEKLLK